MKSKGKYLISILAVLSPIIAVLIMLLIEPEILEAILSGLLLGGLIGSAFGVVSLVMNKGESKLVTAISIVPMCFVVLYLILLLPYLLSSSSAATV